MNRTTLTADEWHHAEPMTASDIINLTGLTYRQLDYWVSHDIVPTINLDPKPGSGNHRLFSPEVIPRIRTLIDVQASFENSLSVRILKGVYDAWPDGKLKLSTHIYIVWA